MVRGDICHLDESDIQRFRSGIFTAVKNTGIFTCQQGEKIPQIAWSEQNENKNCLMTWSDINVLN